MIEVRANGVKLDVKDGEKIKYTKQVADIADVSTVNASATNSFKLPKSPTNLQAMQFLGIPGDGSQIPYKKVVAQLLDDGLPLVKSGWLEVKNTDDNYNASITDGIIDFFKAIEGKKLGTDVDLSELNHVKNVQAVIDSLNNEFYTYLVNDYGGKTVLDLGLGTKAFNIDYLVPSARIQYLWQRFFETFGFTFSGEIFSNINFVNAWMTYPKTNSELIQNEIATYTLDQQPPTNPINPSRFFYEDGVFEFRTPFFPITWSDVEVLLPDYLQTNLQLTRLNTISVLQPNNYQLRLNFTATAIYEFVWLPNTNVKPEVEAPVKITIYKNGQTQSGWTITGSQDELVIPFSAEAGDVISFKIFGLTHQEFNAYRESQDEAPASESEFVLANIKNLAWESFEVKAFQIEYSETDFNNTFKDFDIKSFAKEVMWRFALVPIADNETNHITFYNIDELLDESKGVIDWSDKYVRRTNERYTIGSYAQNNFLRHKYNTEDSNYYDGVIQVANENLNEEATLLTSKTYAPEQDISRLDKIGAPSYINVFPALIWQSEVTTDDEENISVKYKGLTGRYYWLKKNQINSNAIFASENLGESEMVESFNAASILDTVFSDTTPKYHQGHIRQLNDIRIHDIELCSSITDITNIDFTRLYYFKQEASYYRLNKVNWEEGKNAIGEFIRIKRKE